MRKRIDVIGKRFGRLCVISDSESGTKKHRKVTAKCDCGKVKDFYVANLVKKTSKTLSCGCLNMENKTSHGASKHPLFKTWEGMMRRCYNDKHICYKNYGGRGIFVCYLWHNPESFIEWAEEKGLMRGLQIDRIDNNGPYSPDNCRIVTPAENSVNKRISRKYSFRGEVLTISQASKRYGIKYTTLRSRLDKGISADDAISIPVENTTKSLRSRL